MWTYRLLNLVGNYFRKKRITLFVFSCPRLCLGLVYCCCCTLAAPAHPSAREQLDGTAARTALVHSGRTRGTATLVSLLEAYCLSVGSTQHAAPEKRRDYAVHGEIPEAHRRRAKQRRTRLRRRARTTPSRPVFHVLPRRRSSHVATRRRRPPLPTSTPPSPSPPPAPPPPPRPGHRLLLLRRQLQTSNAVQWHERSSQERHRRDRQDSGDLHHILRGAVLDLLVGVLLLETP
jgi:hypothetical protein